MNAVVFCDVLCVLRMSRDCLCCSYVWLQSASDEEVNLSSCVLVAHVYASSSFIMRALGPFIYYRFSVQVKLFSLRSWPSSPRCSRTQL